MTELLEFQESEIVFPESVNFDGSAAAVDKERNFSGGDSGGSRRKKKQRKSAAAAATGKKEASSLPVNIPESWLRYVDVESDLFGDCTEDGQIVPPHLISGRRIAGKMIAFSVCTGYGRTLKGRDLSEVRNSILRMTGFLEA